MSKGKSGVRMERGGSLVPWSKWCKVWGHYFRPGWNLYLWSKRKACRLILKSSGQEKSALTRLI